MAEYGYFDEEAREYVITNPVTPAPWINYLTGGGLWAFLSQTAGGLAFYREPAEGRLTRYRFNGPPLDSPGFYTYVQDGKHLWNPGLRPTGTALDSYRCRHGMGYTILEAEKRQLAATVTYVIPPEDPVLLWKVRLENRSDQPKPVKLSTYVEFSLHTFSKDDLAYLVCGNQWRLTFDPKLNAVKIDYFAFESPFAGQSYFAANRPVDAFEIDRERFLGPGRTEANPLGLERGLQNSEVPDGGRFTCGVLQHALTLAPGESTDVVYRYAVSEDFRKSARLLRKYHRPESVDRAVEQSQTRWDRALGAAQMRTPSPEMNAMMNTWFPYGARVTFYLGRSISTRHTGGGGALRYRDSMQDAMPAAVYFPADARKRLLDILHTMYRDGHCVTSANPETLRPMPGDDRFIRSDAAVWGVMAVYSYLAETGDFGFLQEAVPYLDGGEDTVFDHLLQSLRFISRHMGKHGLPDLFAVDWNDFLQIFTVSYSGCQSVMVAQQFIYAARLLGEIAAKVGREGECEFLRRTSERLRRVLESEVCWDGEWYRRVLGDNVVMGSKTSGDAQIFLNTQSWAVLCGALDPERTRQAMDAAYERLNTPYGIRLFAPPFRTMPGGGRVPANTPGAGENGGIFLHANTWAVMAEAALGRGDRAWEYFSQILPPVLSGRDPERYLNEPYAFSSWVYGPDHERYGGGQLSWLTGGAAWMTVVGWEYLLGLRPRLEGLEVNPCLPHDWPGYSARRVWRGTVYEIEVSNPERICTGEVALVADGRPLEGNLLPPTSRKRVRVQATLRAQE